MFALIVIDLDVPFSKNGIICSKSPSSHFKPSVSNISLILIFVAFEGPLLVTVIVNTTVSPTI